MLKATFLGTGTSQGVPVVACHCKVCASADPRDTRLRTSLMIEKNGKTIVFDSGPDFRQQMLNSRVLRLDALIFTHEHKDHVAGMDDVRAFNYAMRRDVQIYATERVQEALKREFIYVFNGDDYPGIPRVKLNTITNEIFFVEGIEIIPVEVLHYRLPVLGFRIDDFAYITDAKTISDSEKLKLRDLKVLVLNTLRREDHVSHLTLDEALALIAELKPRQAYLTHLSHQIGLHAQLEKELPDGVFCGYDGLVLEM